MPEFPTGAGNVKIEDKMKCLVLSNQQEQKGPGRLYSNKQKFWCLIIPCAIFILYYVFVPLFFQGFQLKQVQLNYDTALRFFQALPVSGWNTGQGKTCQKPKGVHTEEWKLYHPEYPDFLSKTFLRCMTCTQNMDFSAKPQIILYKKKMFLSTIHVYHIDTGLDLPVLGLRLNVPPALPDWML